MILIPFLLVLVAGFVETVLYTAFLLLLGRGQKIASSVFMCLYIYVGLLVLKYMMDESISHYLTMFVYSAACASGNYLAMVLDDKIKHFTKKTKWWRRHKNKRKSGGRRV